MINKMRYTFINRSLFLFALLLVLTATPLVLHLRHVITINPGIINIIKFFFSCAIVIVITNIFLRTTVNSVFSMFEKDLEIEQRILLTKLYSIFFYTIAVSIILYFGGVGLNDIALFLGLVATGIALAVRDIIMSFFIWLIILTKHPFKMGDVITSADDTGIVDRIGTFYVTLKVRNGQETHLVRIPNKMLLDRNLRNHGKNKISGELKVTIQNVPEDLKSWAEKVRKDIITEGAETFSSIDADGKDLHLTIKYLTTYGNGRQTKLNILSALYKKHGDVLREKKDGKS